MVKCERRPLAYKVFHREKRRVSQVPSFDFNSNRCIYDEITVWISCGRALLWNRAGATRKVAGSNPHCGYDFYHEPFNLMSTIVLVSWTTYFVDSQIGDKMRKKGWLF